VKRFRAYYGAQPLHLLAVLVSFALVAAGFVSWFEPGSDTRDILAWLAVCAVGVELILLPLAWALDRIAFGSTSRPSHSSSRRAVRAYVRVPAMLSGLLLLVFLPLILRLGGSTYRSSTGTAPHDYLARWLLASACLFAGSALLYAARLARSRRRGRAATEDEGVS
jgi:hypothetical protein